MQEIKETIRANKLMLPDAEHYSNYINGFRPRMSITGFIVWKKQTHVLDYRNNHEVAEELIKYNLTSMES